MQNTTTVKFYLGINWHKKRVLLSSMTTFIDINNWIDITMKIVKSRTHKHKHHLRDPLIDTTTQRNECYFYLYTTEGSSGRWRSRHLQTRPRCWPSKNSSDLNLLKNKKLTYCHVNKHTHYTCCLTFNQTSL